MADRCIFCLQENLLTEEHVVPESIGGSLSIWKVCSDCNSKLGSEVDARFTNQLPAALVRFVQRLSGKSGTVPNPFRTGGKTADGLMVSLDDELHPEVIPSVRREQIEGGEIIEITVDASAKENLPALVQKAVQRTLKKQHPEMTDSVAEEQAQAIREQALVQAQESSTQEWIHYEIEVDLAAASWLYVKIAYELAFHVLGYDYIDQSATAQSLRTAITEAFRTAETERQPPPQELFQFSPEIDKFAGLLPEDEMHIVLLTDGQAYIRLFGIWGLVVFEEAAARFKCTGEAAMVFEFDFDHGIHREESLAERVARMEPEC